MHIRRIAVAAAVLIQLVALVLVVRQNAKLRRQIGARTASLNRLAPGDRVGRLPLITLTGQQKPADFTKGRRILAIVDPTCGSCVRTMNEVHADPTATVVSVATAAVTTPIAEKAGIASMTYTLDHAKLPPAMAQRLRYFPQVVLIDRGIVMRTCKSVAECRI
jgi:hypothetical protein